MPNLTCMKPSRIQIFHENKSTWTSKVPAEGKCRCGKIVVLQGDSMGEVGCSCGRVYNIFGQELSGFTSPWSGMNDMGEYYDDD